MEYISNFISKTQSNDITSIPNKFYRDKSTFGFR